MDIVWIVLGVTVLTLTLVDTFLTVLSYDESGLFVDKFVRVQWLLLRALTRRVGRRWRPVVLRQVTGVLLVATILWWLCGILLGFALIYLGAMGISGTFQISAGVTRDFLGALYLSVGQFSTVGVDNISPSTFVVNVLTVSEAMVSIVLLSFIITFLGSVYGVIQSLRALSSNFSRIGRGIGDPVDTLVPFFPDGQPRGLDSQLGSIGDSLSAYAEGLAQNRAAYYFQSGRDQFALPFALDMTAGVVGALRWGLPEGSDPAKEPNLARLGQTYEEVRLRMQRWLRLAPAPQPVPVSADEFSRAVAALLAHPSRGHTDPWVQRFLTIDRRMAALTGSDAGIDAGEAYRRYLSWLPFAVRARVLTDAIAKDLDYQPIYRDVATTPDGIPLAAIDVATLPPAADPGPPVPASPPPRPRGTAVGRWLRRRHLFIDPGFVRLAGAIRSLAGVLVAVCVILPLAGMVPGVDQSQAAVFTGLVALFSAPRSRGGSGRGAWWLGALPALPAALGATLGVLLPRGPVSAIVAIAAIAALATWFRRFGPLWGGLGQLVFVTYYVTLLLGLDAQDLPVLLVATGVGLLSTWVVNLLPQPRARSQVRAGIDALYERVGLLLDTMMDVVSTGRADPRTVRMLRSEQSALAQTAGVVAGQLDDDTVGIPATQVRALRTRVFDVQLAAQGLVTRVPAAASIAIREEQRARLAAEMLAVQRELSSFRPGEPTEEPRSGARDAGARSDWPAAARSILIAVGELRSAVSRLHQAEVADTSAGEFGSEEPLSQTGHGVSPPPAPDPAAARERARAADKQSLQAAVSTGVALFLGELVATGHQYWAAMPAFQVLSGSDAETRSKGFQRIAATIAGSGVAFGLAALFGHAPEAALPLLVISAFLTTFVRPVSSAWTAFWMTLMLATVYDLLGTLSVETIEVRLAETAIGALVAVVVSAAILPTRARTRVLSGMAAFVDGAADLSRRSFDRLLGADSSSAADLTRSARELSKKLADVEAVAHAMRRNPGSLQTGGIEAQLTCLWSIVDYQGHIARLVRDVTLPPTARPPWRRASVITADDYDAVRAVLSGTLPARVHPPEELDIEVGADGDRARAQRALLLQVQRLNLTLLALLDAVAPGTVDSMTAQGNVDDPSRDADAART